MSRLNSKRTGLKLRKHRIADRVKGSPQRLRLSVFISNKHISAQIIDDSVSRTLVSVNSQANSQLSGNMSDKAKWVGTEIAKQAKSQKIELVVLDRNGKLYHGRVKQLAEAARAEGLKF